MATYVCSVCGYEHNQDGELADDWSCPVCGAGNPQRMQPIVDAKLPVWIHQGGRDPVVPVEHVVASARALEASGHPEVRMTVHEDLNHDVWTRVYEGADLYNWFLRQRRAR